MAANDIRVFNSPLGGHSRKHQGRANDTAFRVGEVVFIDADGDVDGVGNNPATIAGVALEPVGPTATPHNNYKTGTAYATGDVVSFVAATSDTFFVTSKFSTDGTATALAVPTRANIGDLCGIAVGAQGNTVDTAVANKSVIILDVLDANGVTLQRSDAGTGTQVVFKFGAFLAGVNIQFQSIA